MLFGRRILPILIGLEEEEKSYCHRGFLLETPKNSVAGWLLFWDVECLFMRGPDHYTRFGRTTKGRPESTKFSLSGVSVFAILQSSVASSTPSPALQFGAPFPVSLAQTPRRTRLDAGSRR